MVVFHCVYWLASEDLLMHKYDSLMDFLKLMKCPNVEKLSHSKTATYTSETTANDILKSIASHQKKPRLKSNKIPINLCVC